MLVKSHIALYLGFLMVVSRALSAQQFLLAGLAGIFFSAVPDLDEKNSRISRKYPFLSFFTRFFAKEHHGMTHSPFFLFAVSIFIAVVLSLFAESFRFWLFAVYAPMLIHLMADMITSRIPLLYPFSGKKMGFALFRTGSVYEKISVIILIGTAVIYMVKQWT